MLADTIIELLKKKSSSSEMFFDDLNPETNEEKTAEENVDVTLD